MFKYFKEFRFDLLNLFFPAICISCGSVLARNNVIICNSCYSGLHKITPEQTEIFLNRINKKSFDNIYIMFEFSELFQKLMHLFKYEGHLQIAKYFAKSAFETINDAYDYVSFVPLHKTKQRERGFNQSEVIASYYCSFSKCSLNNKLLKRVRYTKSQTKLDRQKRKENIHNAFALTEDVEGKSILIIDDDDDDDDDADG